MYNQKLVASIKAKGKILREFSETVYIPYGTEYSILLKNLNTVRALVNVYIDGKSVVAGGLVINPGKSVDLERAVTSSNMNAGNKFKFIERTQSIEEHRGIKLEDGLVRIEYQFELVSYPAYADKWHTSTWPHDNWYNSTGSPIIGSTTANYSTGVLRSAVPKTSQSSVNDTGITVAGGKSDQQFQTASWFPVLPEKHSIVMCLKGETPANKEVTEAITTKHKPKCTTCGKQNKATAKFCQECGTALELFS